MLARCQLDPDDRIKTTGLEGSRLWRFYCQEGVFHVSSAGWDAALCIAINWTQTLAQNAPFLLIMHAALAVERGATHFSLIPAPVNSRVGPD